MEMGPKADFMIFRSVIVRVTEMDRLRYSFYSCHEMS